jgi:hypothetical protein
MLVALLATSCTAPVAEPQNIAAIDDSLRIVRTLTAKNWRLRAIRDPGSYVPRPQVFDSLASRVRYHPQGMVTSTTVDVRTGTVLFSTSGTWQLLNNVSVASSQSARWNLQERFASSFNTSDVAENTFLITELSSLTLVLTQPGLHGPISTVYEAE